MSLRLALQPLFAINCILKIIFVMFLLPTLGFLVEFQCHVTDRSRSPVGVSLHVCQPPDLKLALKVSVPVNNYDSSTVQTKCLVRCLK